MVGLENGLIRKNLTKSDEAQRSSWGTQKKKKTKVCRVVSFFRQLTEVTYILVLHWLPCQAPDVVVSALGEVVPVSVYGGWVR